MRANQRMVITTLHQHGHNRTLEINLGKFQRSYAVRIILDTCSLKRGNLLRIVSDGVRIGDRCIGRRNITLTHRPGRLLASPGIAIRQRIRLFHQIVNLFLHGIVPAVAGAVGILYSHSAGHGTGQ